MVQVLTACCCSRQVRHVVQKSLQQTRTKVLLTRSTFPAALVKKPSDKITRLLCDSTFSYEKNLKTGQTEWIQGTC